MPTIRIMDIGGWLRSLGLEQYEAAFQANAVDADVLRDLTDQDLQKLGVLLGDRRKLLRAIAALDGAFAPASAPRPTSLPISLETILAAAATRASPKRPAEIIGDRSLVSTERTTSWLTASDDRDGDDIQAAEIGEPYEADEYHDDAATPRWRYRLVMVVALIALTGLAAVGAFAYRTVSAGAVLPALPPTVQAENAPNEDIKNEGDNRPSDLSQTSVANAGASEEFVSRFPADNQDPPKTVPISPDPSTSPPSALGSAVAAMATAPSISSIAAPATSVPPKVAAPVPAPSSSTPKKIKTAVSRSDGSGKVDTSAATTKSPAAKPSAAAAAGPAVNQPALDAAATTPEAVTAALPVARPLSLTPDSHDHSAASSPSRSRMPAGTGTTAGASSGGGYEVAVASERSAADADAVFRSLQAKFPNKLGGREPIVRRTDLGPEGTYYRASVHRRLNRCSIGRALRGVAARAPQNEPTRRPLRRNGLLPMRRLRLNQILTFAIRI